MSTFVTFKIRRDTSGNWTSENPVLAAGEPAIETDTFLQKTGDGTTTWDSLNYNRVRWSDISGTQASITLTTPANTSPFTVSGYSLTGSASNSLVSLTGTLNTSASPDVILVNITNTSSGGATNLLNFKVGGSSVFNVVRTGDVGLAAGANLTWTGRAAFRGIGNGILMLANSAATDFGRLQIGGTTSSFPSIKRSGTALQARLADDSGFATWQGKLTTDTNYTAGTVVPTGYLTLYDAAGTAYRVPCLV